MILYVDGSQLGQNTKNVTAGYAVLAVAGNETFVRSGKKSNVKEGIHEAIAFIESCLFLVENNINPEDVSFFVDCDRIGYANQFSHKENFNPQSQRLKNLIESASSLYSDGIIETVYQYLHSCRITKVFSHRMDTPIYHRRADYLAYCAARDQEPEELESWMNKGFRFITGKGK